MRRINRRSGQRLALAAPALQRNECEHARTDERQSGRLGDDAHVGDQKRDVEGVPVRAGVQVKGKVEALRAGADGTEIDHVVGEVGLRKRQARERLIDQRCRRTRARQGKTKSVEAAVAALAVDQPEL